MILKAFKVKGFVCKPSGKIRPKKLYCVISEDKDGILFSVSDKRTQFCFPFERVQKIYDAVKASYKSTD